MSVAALNYIPCGGSRKKRDRYHRSVPMRSRQSPLQVSLTRTPPTDSPIERFIHFQNQLHRAVLDLREKAYSDLGRRAFKNSTELAKWIYHHMDKALSSQASLREIKVHLK